MIQPHLRFGEAEQMHYSRTADRCQFADRCRRLKTVYQLFSYEKRGVSEQNLKFVRLFCFNNLLIIRETVFNVHFLDMFYAVICTADLSSAVFGSAYVLNILEKTFIEVDIVGIRNQGSALVSSGQIQTGSKMKY